MFYVATAHRADSVIQSVKGPFTGPDDLNLIIAKSLHLELYVVVDVPATDDDGSAGADQTSTAPAGKTLRPILDNIPIYGRVAYIDLYKPPSSPTSLLYILTEHQRYSILRFNPTTSAIETLCTGDLTDRTGRLSSEGIMSCVDPKARVI
ncbi:DNA damage-binding protein 1, partial [Rhizophlyctis rosea]